jgi:HSP20 family protein
MSSRDPEGWMWAEACELLGRADRLNRQFFQPARARAHRPTWEPPMDVFETEHELWILVALPGVEPDRLEVVAEAGTLVVAGERALPPQLREAHLHRLELPYGRFERRVSLPPGRYEIGRRDLINGCLTLSLRKLG